MLYYLFEWLHKLNFPGAGMFGYTSFRALMAVILALLISSIWGDKFINLLKTNNIEINRKMLSEMAIYDAEGFAQLVEIAKVAN